LIATLATGMPDTPPNAELLRSLGRLVRGLSALFWGLPVTLIVCVQTAKTEMLHTFNILPPLLTTGWVLHGLWQLGYFQKQERIWVSALDRAKQLGMVQLGLSPFLFWFNQRPDEQFFIWAVGAMAVGGLWFLSSLNLVLYRLSAMLPDENLRMETRHFTTLNRFLVWGIGALGAVWVLMLQFPALLGSPAEWLVLLGSSGLWMLVFLALLPLAMTMALIWKIKEVILESVFGPGN
jgi:hypothetical protein